jgi:hypothetical protein
MIAKGARRSGSNSPPMSGEFVKKPPKKNRKPLAKSAAQLAGGKRSEKPAFHTAETASTRHTAETASTLDTFGVVVRARRVISKGRVCRPQPQIRRTADARPCLIHGPIWTSRRSYGGELDATPHPTQAVLCRRRHQPRRPPPAKIRPGSPAPAMGPGTATPLSEKAALNVGAGVPSTRSVPTLIQSGCKASSRIQV